MQQDLASPGADNGLAPIRGFRKAYVCEADRRELVGNPLGGCSAFFGRELAGISHRPEGDEFAELSFGLLHQAGNALSQLHVRLATCYWGRLQLLDHLLKSG